MDNFEVYVAGFFDGEGHVRIQEYKSKGKVYKRLVMSITQVNVEPLHKIADYFNAGKVVEKFDKRAQLNGWQICYNLVATDLSARKILVPIEPYLIVKKDIVGQCLDECGRILVHKSKVNKYASAV